MCVCVCVCVCAVCVHPGVYDRRYDHSNKRSVHTRRPCLVKLQTDFAHNECSGGGNSRDDLTGNSLTLQEWQGR